jgi:hypothetical protein
MQLEVKDFSILETDVVMFQNSELSVGGDMVWRANQTSPICNVSHIW